jgi:hypothetical protein
MILIVKVVLATSILRYDHGDLQLSKETLISP